LDKCHYYKSSERAIAAFETGLKILKRQIDRFRNSKYIVVDYDKVDHLSKKIIDFISVKEREELIDLIAKFSDQERVIECFLESRFVLKKPYKQI
jgi:hypothetical protein